MTAHELAQVLLSGPNDPVTAGGQKVRVLYVAESDAPASSEGHV